MPSPPASAASRSHAARLIRPPSVLGVAAAVAVLLTLSPSGGGPGITCDELYYVAAGKRYVSAFLDEGPAFFQAANVDRSMGFVDGGPPPHPPLGVWLIGWMHWLLDFAPEEPDAFWVAAARAAPALAFGALVWLVGTGTARLAGGRAGNWAGGAAAAATALSPRLFAHAHLATIEIFAALFFVAAILALPLAAERGRWWHFALAGTVWGLAMLTKINGLLIVVPAAAWIVWRLRTKCAAPLAAWGAAGFLTLLVGWPWLWTDTFHRFTRFVSSGTERITLHNYYLGQVWNDAETPWHYPWVLFAVTVPLGLLVLGGVGLWSAARDGERRGNFALPAAGLLFLLLVFSWPGVPVYDGERLFLAAYPLWACFVGLGAQRLVEGSHTNGLSQAGATAVSAVRKTASIRRTSSTRKAACAILLAGQAIGLVLYHPLQLSYYNALVGGLWGAERLGFETTYWGDSVQGPLLDEAAKHARGGKLLFGPNLAPFHGPAVAISTPQFDGPRGVKLVPFDPAQPEAMAECRYALVFRRQADLAQLAVVLENSEVVAENVRQGVWLARLVRVGNGRGSRD